MSTIHPESSAILTISTRFIPELTNARGASVKWNSSGPVQHRPYRECDMLWSDYAYLVLEPPRLPRIGQSPGVRGITANSSRERKNVGCKCSLSAFPDARSILFSSFDDIIYATLRPSRREAIFLVGLSQKLLVWRKDKVPSDDVTWKSMSKKARRLRLKPTKLKCFRWAC